MSSIGPARATVRTTSGTTARATSRSPSRPSARTVERTSVRTAERPSARRTSWHASPPSARTTVRRTRVRRGRAFAALVLAGIVACLAGGLLSSSASGPLATLRAGAEAVLGRGPLGEADGRIPAGTTVFSDDVPGVADLDRALLRALRRAGTVAARDGVVLVVDSGRRSPAYQERLRRDAVARYGSSAEAARWVATGDRSAHVSGDAVDLASTGAAWLAEHGAAFGLCRIYDNEPWHFELRPAAVRNGCPERYADPTHDPRLRP
jgi:zinc D-Ala-D-Ala carboxypeptidase